ncbi:PREDICTED: TIP41-like protein isoform X1 [Camelina sativa]|uniref:TIP41-like protein isoform X1 n=1 Tax=Camelina sativa TaxID=90675 RepID=A0ABM0U8U1_CAMSA|nr:PREDICTED: TIP41-like protein isoform X1 [Camelina sativa]
METEVDKEILKSSGAELLPDGRRGLRIHGWEIETLRGTILTSLAVEEWEEKLRTSHLPEMVFGENALVLKHLGSNAKIHFNAFDALAGWKQEGLPPVEVPAAAQWKFRSKPSQQVILDYDYTFTTPYCGSEVTEKDKEAQVETKANTKGEASLQWENCEDQIDLAALSLKEPILFYDEVVLYEDELADNGVSLLTVKVRVMPSSWFLLLRFWLRVDGVLMRLRETRMHYVFGKDETPTVLRENCWREATFQSLSAKGYPVDLAVYSDPSSISQRLPVIKQTTQKLKIPRKV